MLMTLQSYSVNSNFINILHPLLPASRTFDPSDGILRGLDGTRQL